MLLAAGSHVEYICIYISVLLCLDSLVHLALTAHSMYCTPAITAIIIHLPQPTVLRFILQLDYSNGIVLSCPDSGCSSR